MLNANGPGFAGLYAGDTVLFKVGAKGREYSDFTAAVLPLLVFTDHVQVKYGPCGHTVNADNFVRLVRRGKRHIAADKAAAAAHIGHVAFRYASCPCVLCKNASHVRP